MTIKVIGTYINFHYFYNSLFQEAEISKKRPTFIKAKERVTHTQKKLESALKTLEQARKAHEAHQADIRKLEDELRQIEEEKAQWERTAVGTTHTGRTDVHLEEAQVFSGCLKIEISSIH